MTNIDINTSVSIPESELQFEFARSGGPGGQNVNKVETRVTVLFNVAGSRSLTDAQKNIVFRKLRSRIDRAGTLRVSAQLSRSQWMNRQAATKKLASLIAAALVPTKRRIASRPTAGSRERRCASKKLRARTKQLRGRVSPGS